MQNPFRTVTEASFNRFVATITHILLSGVLCKLWFQVGSLRQGNWLGAWATNKQTMALTAGEGGLQR